MYWKNILALLLSAILPILYTYFASIFQSFPGGLENFVAVSLWIVGSFIGGWQIKSILVKIAYYKK